MPPSRTYDLSSVASHFEISGLFLAAVPFGHGHINDTFASTFENGGQRVRYVHQRINPAVFKNPAAVMENIHRVTAHLCGKLKPADRRVLTPVQTRDGVWLHIDKAGDCWRTYVMIEDAVSLEIIDSPAQAERAARAFGEFMALLSDLPGPRLHKTIPGFHDTPARFRALREAIRSDPLRRAGDVSAEIAIALDLEPLAHALSGMPERVVHNDTKLNNVLFDRTTGEALCVVDLDTVMPGLALHDFGDLVRTIVSPAAEDERDLSRVTVRIPVFESLVQGYLKSAGALLQPSEKQHLVDAGMVMALETGARFLADHLLGDTYFKVSRDGHNLDRCRTQFRLAQELANRRDAMDRIVNRHS